MGIGGLVLENRTDINNCKWQHNSNNPLMWAERWFFLFLFLFLIYLFKLKILYKQS